jgi:hypothetical protein
MDSPAPARPDHNQTGVDYLAPWPRPPVRGTTIDGHVHLIAARHADAFFAASDHFGFDQIVSQTPLEEAIPLYRRHGHRIHFVAVPNWQKLASPDRLDDWLRRLDAFHHLGARMAKLHLAPGTLHRTGLSIDSPDVARVLREIRARNMVIMTHVGDPDIWYQGKYAADPKFGSRETHYRQWTELLQQHQDWPWLGAHLAGWPENPDYIHNLLARFPNLYLDLSATRWMVREISNRRDAIRNLILAFPDRIIWGSDQVSGDARDFHFYASRLYCHRKLFETAHSGPSPIRDPDVSPGTPTLNGLALPSHILQKIYRDNTLKLLASTSQPHSR